MTVRFAVCAGATLLFAAPSFAGSVALQTVDLNDKEMSTEGGVTTLYLVTKGSRTYCRIAVVHYGEMGKTTFGFAFNPQLFSAVRRDYRYSLPIYMDGGGRVARVSTVSLHSKEGAASLPSNFKEYRSFFNAAQLAKCTHR